MGKDNSSTIRRIIAVILVLPAGYIAYKTHLTNPNYTKLDLILRTFFPALIALAYIIDTWNSSSDEPIKRLVKNLVILLTAIIYGVITVQGNKLNDNQIVGAILIGIFFCCISGISFYLGAYQNRELFKDDLILRKSYQFAIGCFAYSFLQIPLWSVFTGHYPPRAFSMPGAIIATTGVLFGLFGPATPWFIMFVRDLAEIKRSNKDPKDRS